MRFSGAYRSANVGISNDKTNEKFVPHVIEPSFWLDRLLLAVISESYFEKEDWQVIFKIDPKIAPVKCAILPLVKKLSPDAEKIYDELKMEFACEFDETWSIWKRYARQDEIWTPFCVTVDFDTTWTWTESNPDFLDTVTVRNRDNWEQIRLKTCDLKKFLREGIFW